MTTVFDITVIVVPIHLSTYLGHSFYKRLMSTYYEWALS